MAGMIIFKNRKVRPRADSVQPGWPTAWPPYQPHLDSVVSWLRHMGESMLRALRNLYTPFDVPLVGLDFRFQPNWTASSFEDFSNPAAGSV